MNETRFYETNTPGKYATSNAKRAKPGFTRLALPVSMPQAMPKGTKRDFTLAEPTDHVTQSIGIQIET